MLEKLEYTRAGQSGPVPAGQHARLAVVVSERLTLRPLTGLMLLRSPETSATVIDGHDSIVFDQPGLYRLLVECGLEKRIVEVVAFTPETLESAPLQFVQRGPNQGQWRGVPERLSVLRAIVSDREATQERIAAALERADGCMFPIARIFGGDGIDIHTYGG